MSLITEESGICLSKQASTVYVDNGLLERESIGQYLLTESALGITTEDAGEYIPFFDCGKSEVFTSGKNVVIVNTCSLPITITGLKNDNAARFSLFEYPKFVNIESGIYDSGTAAGYLPIELEPFERTIIPTFFHPKESEINNGTAGTWQNRVGDWFTGKVEIFPGFPVANCPDSIDSCEASFRLSGEFICNTVDIPSFLDDSENFITPFDGTLPDELANVYCIPNSEIMQYYSSYGSPLSAENQYLALKETIAFVENNNPKVQANPAYKGALDTVVKIIDKVVADGLDSDINNLFSSSVTDEDVSSRVKNPQGEIVFAEMSGSYRGDNTSTVTLGAYSTNYTGLNIDMSGDNAYMQNSTVFLEIGPPRIGLFVATSGDFSSHNLC
jgi:hypothetical protein